MNVDGQFRRRVLLVDGDARFLQTCSGMLREQGYEVLTAQDGFAALCALRGGHPDLLITELDLPRMSGFELLSVVRSRFPQIAVIALSDEFTPVRVPHEAVCDSFLAKGPNLHFEVVEEARRLVSESPLRSTRAKSEVAPVWIPHSASGYIVLTCPECLRSFSAVQPVKPGPANESCVCCGANVPFDMSSVEVSPAPPPASPEDRLHRAQAKSRQLRAEAQILREKRRKS
ncbi:MAG TPA: response regulator [Terriglobales bacterium]|nr:response regulator [Terriglobales bacterium]